MPSKLADDPYSVKFFETADALYRLLIAKEINKINSTDNVVIGMAMVDRRKWVKVGDPYF